MWPFPALASDAVAAYGVCGEGRSSYPANED
ncbi:hypothetical protein SAMN06296058_3201 [Pseudoxanthomonas indica]|uniref:Uncharacterized protein n=1 Tax=Pseudoxanthomonas indica TaxID=428993 RepID=A0A1T5LVR5_9GAMM|nr:hypothetical protein SAMN06296058_3201 [Pseudoxanthomonas indica]